MAGTLLRGRNVQATLAPTFRPTQTYHSRVNLNLSALIVFYRHVFLQQSQFARDVICNINNLSMGFRNKKVTLQ